MIYPKINLAIGYEVDPSWPRRPEGLAWGHMPGVGTDNRDRVYLFTRAEVPVQVYDADGTFIRAWGRGIAGRPHHLEVDHEGNVWLADDGRHVVRKYTPEGELLLTLGTLDEPGCDATHLNGPTDMAITAEGEVFVSDGYGNNRVVHFDGDGHFINSWGELGVEPGQFSLPHAIAVDSRSRIYVAGRNNVRIQVFDAQGRFLDEWRNLIVPWGLCVTRSDEIWVVGSSPMQWEADKEQLGGPPKDQIFTCFDPEGRVRQLWTVPKVEDGQEYSGACNMVHGIGVDSQGNLYVGDIAGQRVQKFVRKE